MTEPLIDNFSVCFQLAGCCLYFAEAGTGTFNNIVNFIAVIFIAVVIVFVVILALISSRYEGKFQKVIDHLLKIEEFSPALVKDLEFTGLTGKASHCRYKRVFVEKTPERNVFLALADLDYRMYNALGKKVDEEGRNYDEFAAAFFQVIIRGDFINTGTAVIEPIPDENSNHKLLEFYQEKKTYEMNIGNEERHSLLYGFDLDETKAIEIFEPIAKSLLEARQSFDLHTNPKLVIITKNYLVLTISPPYEPDKMWNLLTFSKQLARQLSKR